MVPVAWGIVQDINHSLSSPDPKSNRPLEASLTHAQNRHTSSGSDVDTFMVLWKWRLIYQHPLRKGIVCVCLCVRAIGGGANHDSFGFV